MHDDIMDEADLRRGHLTVHKKFGVNEAILSGDVLLIYAYKALTAYSPDIQAQLMELFNDTAIEVCEGQSMDTSFENRMDVTEKEYVEMIRLKTAVLLAAALKMGAIIGGASNEEANLLYEFGVNLGIGFQIQDDILDTYGNEAVGKKIGGDIVQNKKTLLFIKALAKSEQNNDNALLKLIEQPNLDDASKISQVKAIYNQYKVLEYAEDLKNQHVNKAMMALKKIQQSHDLLTQIADQLVNRNY